MGLKWIGNTGIGKYWIGKDCIEKDMIREDLDGKKNVLDRKYFNLTGLGYGCQKIKKLPF